MSEIFDRIDKLRNNKGVSANKMMTDLQFSTGLYHQWKKGMQNPSPPKIAAIADYFGVTVDYILNGVSEASTIEIISDKVYQIPVYESVSAGLGVYADSKIVGYTSVTVKKSDINNIIAAKVIGDSMYPHINDGDTVIIKKTADVESGDVAVVMIDDEAVVKKVKFDKDSLTLISFNPEYKDRVIKESDYETVRIVGKVIGSYKSW